MADRAEDVGLLALWVQGVAHGLAINGEAGVLVAINLIPCLECLIQLPRIDTDQQVAEHRQAGHLITAFFSAATGPLPGLLAEAFGPIRDGLVAPHPAQNSSAGDG